MSEEQTHASAYRPAVGILLLNPAGLAFAGRRRDIDPDAWQMPQGGIGRGEDPERAAFRELREETGVEQAKVLASTPGWLRYDLPPEIAPRLWRGRYRGQRQKWFAMRHEGPESEIDVGPGGEFSAWRWVEPRTLPDIIVPFKRNLYEQVLKEFEGIIEA